MNFTIPGPIPPKKNSKKIIRVNGRILIIPSKSHEEWFKNARYALIGAKPVGDISSVEIAFWWPDMRRRDMSNAAESIMDLLVDGGIIEDDSWQYVPRLVLVSAGVDRAKPRAEVSVKED